MAGDKSRPPGASEHQTRWSGVVADAYEHVPVALMRVTGPEQRYVAANAAYRALVGRDELVGRTPREVLPELAGQQHLEILDRVFHTGEAEQHRAWRTQVQRSGSPDLTELYLDIGAAPFHQDDGSVGGVDLTLVDVTEMVLQRAAEQRHAQQLAHRARQQYAEGRELVMELQDALLPGELPVLPTLDVAARYLLAADDAAAGGDWFDVVVRDDGTIVLVVGDVVGHGVTASAVMGQLRAVLHQRLLTDSLYDALAGLDRYAGTAAESHAATVCAVHLDPSTGALEYCTAGHPAPLVVSTDGTSRFLAPTGSSPLATRRNVAVAADRLEPGDVLLLYTDGIIERPGTPPARSTMDLSRVALDAVQNRGLRQGAAGRTTERVCELVLELLVRISGYRDDVTLLAVQRTPAAAPIRMRLPADKATVRIVRERLADWLESLEIRPLDELCVQHAVGELVANVVEHAYPAGATGSVALDAAIDDTGLLRVSVADQGRWRDREDEPPRSPHRGNGLAMVHEFVDHLALSRSPHGTTATVRHRLSRPAHLLRADADRRARVAEPPFHVDDRRAEARLVVKGVVDVSTADSLRHSLLQASTGGTADLVVDLAEVTHLASAGVQVLSEVLASHPGLDLQAPIGSVAQHVLETVRLPYQMVGADPRA